MVRRRLRGDERPSAGRHTLTDVVGTLVSIDDTNVVIAPRRGPNVTVARADIVAAKEVPPTPGRRGLPHRAITVSDLEEVMAEGWVAEEVEWDGRWLLRASRGYTKRGNSCLTLGAPSAPTANALSSVEDWYGRRGLPAIVQVPLPPGASASDDDLVRSAVARGWQVYSPTLVMSASVGDVLTACDADADDTVQLDVASAISPDWWYLADERAHAHEDAARGLLTRSPEQIFVTASVDGAPLAHARVAFARGWGGMFDIATDESARRRGLARAVIAAGGREASRRGVPSLYLQVESANAAAVALYEKVGFTTHHSYVYAEAPGT